MRKIMKKLFIAAFIFVSTFTTSTFAEVKMGIILGFTGPIESLTPAMAASAELAFKEASDSGSLLGGKKIEVVRADSTCVDSAAATAAAEGLNSQGVAAIMGALFRCNWCDRIKCCCAKWYSNDITFSNFSRFN